MKKVTTGKGFVVCLSVGLAAAAGAVTEASESKVVDSSRTLPGGERVLEQSVVVPADGFRVRAVIVIKRLESGTSHSGFWILTSDF